MEKEVYMLRNVWLKRCLLILCTIAPGAASAADYHVSPRGDDASPGSATAPWQTIARVNKADLEPGDRVLFEGGQTFAGAITLDAQDSGVQGRRVEIGSYGTGRATIDGRTGSGLIAAQCDHLIIRNLRLVGSGRKNGNNGSGVKLNGGVALEVDQIEVSGFRLNGVSIPGVRGARITHVYVHDSGSAGISVGEEPSDGVAEDVYIGHCVAENNPGDPLNLTNHSGNGIVVGCVRGCLVEYCEAMNNGWDMPRTGNGPVGIWTWNADRVIVQFCIAHDNKSPGDDGGGFDIDGGVTNSVFQYNYSYNNDGPGQFLCQYYSAPAWRHNIVRYNISVNDSTKNNRRTAFDVYCGDEPNAPGGGMSDAEVYGNTIYNEKGGAVGFGGKPVPRLRFRNNIFIAAGEIIRGDCSAARFEGNLYWSIGPNGMLAAGHPRFEDWTAATGQELREGKLLGLFADPRLVALRLEKLKDPEKLTSLTAYRLRPDSPCLSAGVPIENNGGRDFWGGPVPKTGKLTIGACQQP